MNLTPFFRRMAGMLPVGTRPGDPVPKLSFFWSLPVSALDGDESQRQWRHELEALWPEAAARIKAINVPHGLAAARYRDAVHKQWSRGRAVLLGDSAHAKSPQLGQGVNMALRDALRAHASVPHAFADYQHRRRSHVAAYHFWSRWLTPCSSRNTTAPLLCATSRSTRSRACPSGARRCRRC